jgi:hypothetical protein
MGTAVFLTSWNVLFEFEAVLMLLFTEWSECYIFVLGATTCIYIMAKYGTAANEG